MKPNLNRTVQIVGCSLAALFVLYMLTPVFFPFVVLVSSASYRAKRVREGAKLIAEFHQRFNAGDYEGICREASGCKEFPNLREQWQFLLQDTRNRGGTFKRVIRSDIHAYIEPSGVRANVTSSFEKGELRELFEMKGYGGPLQIESYKVMTGERPGS